MSTLKIGDNVTLKSAHGQYLRITDLEGKVDAKGKSAGPWERLVILRNDGSDAPGDVRFGMQLCLLTSHGNLITARGNGDMTATTAVPQNSEKWTFVNPNNPTDNSLVEANSTISLKSIHGKYMVAERDHRALANRIPIGDWEKWLIQRDPNVVSNTIFDGRSIALRNNSNERYLKIDDYHLVHGDAPVPGPWERLTIQVLEGKWVRYGEKVALKTFHGRYLIAEPDGCVKGDSIAIIPWTLWTVLHPTNQSASGLVDVGDSIVLRSAHGKNLHAESRNRGCVITANITSITMSERFEARATESFLSKSEILGKVEKKIIEVGSLAADYRNYLEDIVYYCPTIEEAYQILRRTHADRTSYRYKEEQFDCDDFSYLLKAEFAKAAYNDDFHRAPWAMGIIFNQYHAYNWMLNSDFVLRLIDSQSGKIYYPSDGDKGIRLIAA